MSEATRTRVAILAVLAAQAALSCALLGIGQGSAREPPGVTPLLSSGRTIVGEAISYPRAEPARITAGIVTLAPGQETGWHTHGIPTFAYVLDGELTVDYGAAGIRTYKAGQAFLEAIEAPHNGRNSGGGPMRVLAVFIGAEGLPTSTPRAGVAPR